jgi:hypothetical protein
MSSNRAPTDVCRYLDRPAHSQVLRSVHYDLGEISGFHGGCDEAGYILGC